MVLSFQTKLKLYLKKYEIGAPEGMEKPEGEFDKHNRSSQITPALHTNNTITLRKEGEGS